MSKKNNKSKAKELTDNNKIRLNKFLAEHGVASRRKADELIQRAVVKVNGSIIIDLGTKINPNDRVTVFGDPVKSKKKNVYIILNKPKDSITTTNDELGRRTVLDIINSRQRIFPVGRLDRNTTGLLLLTNDGELTYRLTHPKYQIERVYNVVLDTKLKRQDAEKIAHGIKIPNEEMSPCEVFINPKDNTKVSLSLTEGKNREIRKIFEYLGYKVKKLDRKYFANLTSAGLKRGEYRHLSPKEELALKKLVRLK